MAGSPGWRTKCPVEFLQCPIGFGAVEYHRSRGPIVRGVGAASRDGANVIDRRKQLVVDDMALARLPIRVGRELRRKQA